MHKEKNETELYCEIREVFQIFDKDNDNYITKKEEEIIMSMFGIPIKENQNEEEQNKEREEDEEDIQNANMVQFNDFFDNIRNRLNEADSDENIIESTSSNQIESRTDAEHQIKSLLNNFIKEPKKEGITKIGNRDIDDIKEARQVLSDIGVYNIDEKVTYTKNLYKAMANKKY